LTLAVMPLAAMPKIDTSNLAKVGSLQAMPTIPSKASVKEVGGITLSGHVDIKLSDGTTVRCYRAATDNPEKPSKNFYYLPGNPHISKSADGTPNFSMIRFVTNKTKEQGGAEGAILHFLVEYGLTPAQQKELAKTLKKEVKGAKLKGAVPLETGAEGNSFSVVSATLGDKGFTSALITSGKAPVMEGQKVAVAARLDAYGATLLAKSLEQPTTDISVVFDLKYLAKIPAYDVKIKIDYDQYHKLSDSYTHERERKVTKTKKWDPKWYNVFHTKTVTRSSLTESEKRKLVDYLKEEGVVEFVYVQHIPDADKEIVESGLYGKVMDIFFDMQKRLGEPTSEELGGEEAPDQDAAKAEEARRKEAAKYGKYRYTSVKVKEISRHSKVELSLKKIAARYEYYTMTGNVGGWYKQYKNNPKLVTEVNLDDPFFARREVRFIIDNEAYDIFDKRINYATVQVRVKRRGQPDFIDEVTVDKKYLENNGQTASLTYAPMKDESRMFDYAVQWSLRGGHLYPAKPKWRQGELMAVTLAAPIKPVAVEAEADLDELEEMNVARVSVELRYKQFGKTATDHKSLAISASSGDPVATATIYPDASTDKLEYRLVYHHKKLGRIEEQRWRSVEGNYIYCSPLETIREKLINAL
jgi:hypothetical protein